MGLIAQFILGTEITNTAILEGFYPQAANLLKQEIETIAALEECAQGKRVSGVNPRVSVLPIEWRKAYGNMNKLAHPSEHDLLNAFSAYQSDDSYGPTTVPQYREIDGRSLLYTHIAALDHLW